MRLPREDFLARGDSGVAALGSAGGECVNVAPKDFSSILLLLECMGFLGDGERLDVSE